MAQTLDVDANYNPQQLIEDVLIGQGVQVSNIQFTGNAAARGYFDGTNSNIGLASGVIISTGRALDAEGPNGTPVSDTGTEFNEPGDAQLTAISGSPLGTFDAAVLEFDFVPSSDTVQFRYVFASNEYMLYVGTGVNDVFAFFISGPGISGEQNVALIPGTATAVTIDNVNANTNSQFYNDNENPPGPTVEYNGITDVFTAQAVLTPCESYHIRLAIADGGDWAFDSAVFLEAGSFTSPSVSLNAESTYSVSNTDQELVEGCSSMTLTFERSAPFDDPLTIGLNVSGTATVGSDITIIPSQITFPAGAATTSISFDVIDDAILEGVENMTITLDQLNPCSTGPATSVDFTIEDAIPLTVQISPDVTFACPQDYTIDVTVVGGYPGYTYDWSGSSETGSSITVSPLTTTTYGVLVTDACGFSEGASVTVNTGGYEPLSVTVEDVVVCNGQNAILEAAVTGGLGDISYLWNGSGTDSTYAFLPTGSTTINVVVTDDCGLTAETTANVIVDEVNASFEYELARHDAIQFTNTTEDTHHVLWEFGDDSTGTALNPRHTYVEPGTYTVLFTVTNANGCEDTVSHEITVYPPLHVYIPNSFTPNGDDLNEYWGIVGEGYLYYDLEIYNRWGDLLHAGRFTDANAWDGMVNGRLVPAG
ncbi:MAG: choice-of-anchor L domain-containing protein, partial [Flavobacteriales bacterium]|nr:choice-of-anchor L domain-containing protein [Flavobacteriales bacterium]